MGAVRVRALTACLLLLTLGVVFGWFVRRFGPYSAYAYSARAYVSLEKKEYDKALADYSAAIRFDAEMALAYNDRAWVWATCRDPRLRDGTKAVESVTKACELTQWKFAPFLETLAAAYAEAGDFDSAVNWQTKAIASTTDPDENHQQALVLSSIKRKSPTASRAPDAREDADAAALN